MTKVGSRIHEAVRPYRVLWNENVPGSFRSSTHPKGLAKQLLLNFSQELSEALRVV